MVEMKLSGRSIEINPSKIVCLLRSYAEHAKEMGNEPPEFPSFFLKPPSALMESGGSIIIPRGSKEVHHEVELAVIIGRRGRNIPLSEAQDHIFGYTVMLDITARDLQLEAKRRGLPWTESKGYDTFAPVGPEMVSSDSYSWKGKGIWLEVNGERRQESSTDMLLWTVEEIISRISEVMTLEKYDIIMTGTPEGVGPLKPGDSVKAGIDGIEQIEVDVRGDISYP